MPFTISCFFPFFFSIWAAEFSLWLFGFFFFPLFFMPCSHKSPSTQKTRTDQCPPFKQEKQPPVPLSLCAVAPPPYALLRKFFFPLELACKEEYHGSMALVLLSGFQGTVPVTWSSFPVPRISPDCPPPPHLGLPLLRYWAIPKPAPLFLPPVFSFFHKVLRASCGLPCYISPVPGSQRGLSKNSPPDPISQRDLNRGRPKTPPLLVFPSRPIIGTVLGVEFFLSTGAGIPPPSPPPPPGLGVRLVIESPFLQGTPWPPPSPLYPGPSPLYGFIIGV